MLVADTSALVSLGAVDTPGVVLEEFDVHTTETVLAELEETAGYEDAHAEAADRALDRRDRLSVHEADGREFASGRVDDGEASCVVLARELGTEFLLTDDLRALPELRAATDARVAISPIVLRSLVERGVLDGPTARERVERLADERGWLGAPIYRRAKDLFEDE